MVSHELMGPWEHCILQCIPTCHGILGIPDPEVSTCGIWGTLDCGTLRTLDRGEKNSKAVADAGESCLTTEKGLYSSLSLSDNAYSDRSRAYFQRLAWRKSMSQCLWNNW